ncbi:Rpn family recombination-promoting nuclease/putative transposase [Candidatus Poribacteria bacterium]|nr:Rpn family recombination-promoting nuclease/putative transposase [Candidatus Poribacteria bacterium]MYF56298.1 Rpn family recombination-promoting nuclease/putative transposase [Candidatus Poribacteria bacterium]
MTEKHEILNREDIKNLFRTDIGHIDDKSIRFLFKHIEHLRGLIQFLSGELTEHLDFSHAKRGMRSYIDTTLRDSISDIVFTVPFRNASNGDEVTIYILIEHQSTVDRMMGLRLHSYMCQIWKDQLEEQRKTKVPVSQQRLSPILPIVFYTGDRRWEIPVTLNAVMDVPELMTRFVPTFETLFLAVKDTDTDEFLEQNHPFGWLMSVTQQVSTDEKPIDDTLMEALTRLDTLSPEESLLHAHALIYLSHLVVSKRPQAEREHLIEHILIHNRDTEVENIIMTGAEALVQQGKAEGLEQGRIDEKRTDVLKVVRHKFADFSDVVLNEISGIDDLVHLDELFDQILAAESFDDIDFSKNGK